MVATIEVPISSDVRSYLTEVAERADVLLPTVAAAVLERAAFDWGDDDEDPSIETEEIIMYLEAPTPPAGSGVSRPWEIDAGDADWCERDDLHEDEGTPL